MPRYKVSYRNKSKVVEILYDGGEDWGTPIGMISMGMGYAFSCERRWSSGYSSTRYHFDRSGDDGVWSALIEYPGSNPFIIRVEDLDFGGASGEAK